MFKYRIEFYLRDEHDVCIADFCKLISTFRGRGGTNPSLDDVEKGAFHYLLVEVEERIPLLKLFDDYPHLSFKDVVKLGPKTDTLKLQSLGDKEHGLEDEVG